MLFDIVVVPAVTLLNVIDSASVVPVNAAAETVKPAPAVLFAKVRAVPAAIFETVNTAEEPVLFMVV